MDIIKFDLGYKIRLKWDQIYRRNEKCVRDKNSCPENVQNRNWIILLGNRLSCSRTKDCSWTSNLNRSKQNFCLEKNWIKPRTYQYKGNRKMHKPSPILQKEKKKKKKVTQCNNDIKRMLTIFHFIIHWHMMDSCKFL